MMSKLQAVETLKSGQKISTKYRCWLEIIVKSPEIKGKKLEFETYKKRSTDCMVGNKELYCQVVNMSCGNVYQNEKYTYEIHKSRIEAIRYDTKEYRNYNQPICFNAYIDIL